MTAMVNAFRPLVLAGNDLFAAETVAGYVATAISAIIGLLITVWVIRRFLFKPLQKMVSTRQEEVESTDRRLKDRQAELEQKEKELADKKSTLEDTWEQERKTRQADAERAHAAMIREAQQEIATMKAQADLEIKRRETARREGLRDEAVGLAIQALESLAGRSVTDGERSALGHEVDEAIATQRKTGRS